MSVDGIGAAVELPMERPLYTPATTPRLADLVEDAVDAAVDTTALYSSVVVDKAVLSRHIRQTLQTADQVTLGELCRARPLEHGLAELVAYLELADRSFSAVIDDAVEDHITWRSRDRDGQWLTKEVRLPRVIFVR